MTFRKKVCSATIFFCIIAHVLLGYFVNKYCGSNNGYYYGWLLYILVPIMPFLVGLKKIHISYEFALIVIYLTVCSTVQIVTKGTSNQLSIWHPAWVIFLTIPIYHIFKDIPTRKRVKIEENDDVIDCEYKSKNR